MKKTIFLSIIFIMISLALSAARPTIHASSLNISNITCHSLQLNWTNGNGSARLIVGREGSPTSFAPGDNALYTPNAHFGHSSQYSGGNYVVYNSQGSNYAVIDSLKSGKTYYFTIFEHDNNGSSTLYYTAGAPSVYDSTYYLNLSFTVNAYDSCETHNQFQFTNTSKTSIPGVSYTFYFGDTYSSSLNIVNHQYINISGAISATIKTSQNYGCLNYLNKTINVYPKKVATFDFTNFEDTQCLNGNYFVMNPVPLISQLPKSVYYNWTFGDGTTSTFKKMVKSYKKAGHFKVELETVIAVNLVPTGCKDTLRFELEVLPAPSPLLGNDTLIYSNEMLILDAGMADRYLWNSSDTGRFLVIDGKIAPSGNSKFSVTTTNTIGCKGYDTITVTIDKSSFIISNKTSTLKLYPNPIIKVLNIDNPESEVFEWSVFSIEGKDIMSGNHLNAQIDFSEKMTGTYLLEIRSPNSILKIKIIKL